MAKHSIILVFSIFLFLSAVASLNIQTTVIEGAGNSISEFIEPFEKINENYYLIEKNLKKTWHGAAHFCRTKNAHLASIESEDEWLSLSSHLVLKGYSEKMWFWIAGNDIDEPLKFYWISTGQPMLFTKWSSNQPDNLGGNERCVHLWRKEGEFLMNDWQCNQEAHYICKINKPKTVQITVW